MFGRSVRRPSALLLLFIFLCGPTQAIAKKRNFVNGLPFGVGFAGGIEKPPQSNFAAGTQTASSSYSKYFAVQPFFDLVNVAFRLTLGWHFYPLLNGAGTDTHGNFTESSDGGSFDYGARILLAPYVNHALDQRVYFILGMGQSLVKLKNIRKYSSGTFAGQSFSEQVQGTGLETNAGVGYEFFVLQNYSLQLEAGYAQREADSFKYRTSTDVANQTHPSGAEDLDAAGRPRGFHVWSPYAQIVLNLNL